MVSPNGNPKAAHRPRIGQGALKEKKTQQTNKGDPKAALALGSILSKPRLLLGVLVDHGDDAHNAGDALAQNTLDTVGKRELGQRATTAGTGKLDRDDTVFGHVNKPDVAAVSKQARTDEVQNRCNIVFIYHDDLSFCSHS